MFPCRISSRGKMSGTFSWLRGCDMKTSCGTSPRKNMEATWRRSCGSSQSFMRGWGHDYSYTPIYIYIVYSTGLLCFPILAGACIYLHKKTLTAFIKDRILLLMAGVQCPQWLTETEVCVCVIIHTFMSNTTDQNTLLHTFIALVLMNAVTVNVALRSFNEF